MSDQKSSPYSAREEPWLRGTLTDVAAVPRAVLHALELAREDIDRWCADLTDEEINARPNGLASVAFHIRHIGNSTDRLLTYAEGKALNDEQLAAARSEAMLNASTRELLSDMHDALDRSASRVRQIARDMSILEEPRTVGRRKLPTTAGGLLVHVADHTQRHVGQAIVTAKLIKALRASDAKR